MEDNVLKRISEIFSANQDVVVAYLFGSRARDDAGPMSDYDFAVQFDPATKNDFWKMKLDLMGDLCDALKTDAVDLVVLNTLDKPELGYAIIYDSKIIFERGLGRVSVEPKMFREYVDFHQALLRYGLTKA